MRHGGGADARLIGVNSPCDAYAKRFRQSGACRSSHDGSEPECSSNDPRKGLRQAFPVVIHSDPSCEYVKRCHEWHRPFRERAYAPVTARYHRSGQKRRRNADPRLEREIPSGKTEALRERAPRFRKRIRLHHRSADERREAAEYRKTYSERASDPSEAELHVAHRTSARRGRRAVAIKHGKYGFTELCRHAQYARRPHPEDRSGPAYGYRPGRSGNVGRPDGRPEGRCQRTESRAPAVLL